MSIGVLCFSLGSRLRGNDVGLRGASPVVATLVSVAWAPFASRKGYLTRKKAGAVFGPVLSRERS